MEEEIRELTKRIEQLEGLLRGGGLGIGGGVIDPPPDGGGFGGPIPWPWPFPRPWPRPFPFPFPFPQPDPFPGPIFDPAPEDLGKLSKVQIESRLADIELNRKKLDVLENMLKERL